MISQIVVLPSCFGEKNISNELIQILKDVKSHPIFIVDFENAKWLEMANNVDSNANISDSLKKSLQVFLKKIRNRIILKDSSQTDFSKIKNWLEEIKKNQNINCTLISPGDITLCRKQNLSSFQNINDVILSDSTTWDSIKILGLEIKKTEAETEKILKTISENTDKVIFVDGYFNPMKKGFKKSLDLISKHLGQSKEYQIEDKKILIHTALKMVSDLDSLKSNIPKILDSLKTINSIDYEFYLWKYIHDRTFLTDKMCLESTSGMEIIEVGSPGENINTKWIFLPHNLSEEQLNKYDIVYEDADLDKDKIIWKYST